MEHHQHGCGKETQVRVEKRGAVVLRGAREPAVRTSWFWRSDVQRGRWPPYRTEKRCSLSHCFALLYIILPSVSVERKSTACEASVVASGEGSSATWGSIQRLRARKGVGRQRAGRRRTGSRPQVRRTRSRPWQHPTCIATPTVPT